MIFTKQEYELEIKQNHFLMCDGNSKIKKFDFGEKRLKILTLSSDIENLGKDDLDDLDLDVLRIYEKTIINQTNSFLTTKHLFFSSDYIEVINEENNSLSFVYMYYMYQYKKNLSYDEFDGLQDFFSMTNFDSKFANDGSIKAKCRLALCRLEFPIDLTDEMKKTYVTFLRRNPASAFTAIYERKDIGVFDHFGSLIITKNNIGAFIETSLNLNEMLLTSYLLNLNQKFFSVSVGFPNLESVEIENSDNKLVDSDLPQDELVLLLNMGGDNRGDYEYLTDHLSQFSGYNLFDASDYDEILETDFLVDGEGEVLDLDDW
jgi:hypothetical protein